MTKHFAPAMSVDDLREILYYTPETGQFQWRVKRGSTKANTPAGTWHRKTKYIAVNRVQFHAADIANYLMTGTWKKMQHIDGNISNNKWSNLKPSGEVLEHESLIKHYLQCFKTVEGWEIASDLPKPFLDALRAKLNTL